MVRRVGILGYGRLGEYLVSKIHDDSNFELAFVWNRTTSKLKGKVPDENILEDISDFRSKAPDIIIEVAHPSITVQHGATFLEYCDYMIGSPTALSDSAVEKKLYEAASSHGLYVPRGAFWGAEDVKRMADIGLLVSLKVTMKFSPSSLKLQGRLKEINSAVTDKAVTLYSGPVREVCKLAPNNVNTMAVGAIAAHNLGFDGVQGCLISDPETHGTHVIEIEVKASAGSVGDFHSGDAVTNTPHHQNTFSVHTVRKNPAVVGAVTGSLTFASFLASLKKAKSCDPGVHLC